jgi:hypothetical protein
VVNLHQPAAPYSCGNTLSPPTDLELPSSAVAQADFGPEKNLLKAHGLTSFIHPSCDPSSTPPPSDDEAMESPEAGVNDHNAQGLLLWACSDIGIPVDMLQPL